MERFTQLLVAGGVSLLAGLWLLDGAPAWSVIWQLGSLLTLLGVGSLGYGIYRGLDRNSSR